MPVTRVWCFKRGDV